MQLSRKYSSKEICSKYKCESNLVEDIIFDQISSITNPVDNSLGFLSKSVTNKIDLSCFSLLLIAEDVEVDSKIPVIKSNNVLKIVSDILSDCNISKNYSNSETFHNVTIGENVKIGNNCQIYPGTFINHNSIIGDNVIIHANTVIGSDGFGYYMNEGLWVKIPHVGGVIIDNNVEIGSNVSIDRGMIDNTHLKDNSKIDNLVHIAHNVVIGSNTAIAACTGIAGSTVIGNNCTVDGGSGINGHITICDDVHIHGMSMITKSITKKGQYASGMPADNVRNWRKNQVLFRNLNKNK